MKEGSTKSNVKKQVASSAPINPPSGLSGISKPGTIGAIMLITRQLKMVDEFVKFLVTDYDKGSYQLHEKNIMEAAKQFRDARE